MSLDVMLYDRTFDNPGPGEPWSRPEPVELYSSNITHNLNRMADEAGIYGPVWRPEQESPPIKYAWELVPILEVGLLRLRSDPERFKAFNAENGWGLYKHFVPWLEEYLKACHTYPQAYVYVSR